MRLFIRSPKTLVIWVIAVMALGLLFLGAVWMFGWGWTGFFSYTTTERNIGNDTVVQTHPGKTLWDVLNLVVIPAVLAFSIFLLNKTQSRTEREITSNQQEEDMLQNYIDAMSVLVLDKRLRYTDKNVESDIDLRNIARSRTLTVLRALITKNPDGKHRRRGSLLRFLYETQLVNGSDPVISLKNANLEYAYMRQFNLQRVNLYGTYLYKADLKGANLE